MTRSLAELRANPPKGRPERTLSLFLAPDLMAEFQSIDQRLAAIDVPADSDGDAKPRRMGEGGSPEADALRHRLGELLEQMAEHEGELRIRANASDGDWRIWCNANPAREEGVSGYDRDQRVTGGYCNADALLDRLGDFVHSWNGEPMSAQDWTDIFEPVIANGDKATIATTIVYMYEQPVDFQQLRSGSQINLAKYNAAASQRPSESPSNDSTAGNLDESTEATTAMDSK